MEEELGGGDKPASEDALNDLNVASASTELSPPQQQQAVTRSLTKAATVRHRVRQAALSRARQSAGVAGTLKQSVNKFLRRMSRSTPPASSSGDGTSTLAAATSVVPSEPDVLALYADSGDDYVQGNSPSAAGLGGGGSGSSAAAGARGAVRANQLDPSRTARAITPSEQSTSPPAATAISMRPASGPQQRVEPPGAVMSRHLFQAPRSNTMVRPGRRPRLSEYARGGPRAANRAAARTMLREPLADPSGVTSSAPSTPTSLGYSNTFTQRRQRSRTPGGFRPRRVIAHKSSRQQP